MGIWWVNYSENGSNLGQNLLTWFKVVGFKSLQGLQWFKIGSKPVNLVQSGGL